MGKKGDGKGQTREPTATDTVEVDGRDLAARLAAYDEPLLAGQMPATVGNSLTPPSEYDSGEYPAVTADDLGNQPAEEPTQTQTTPLVEPTVPEFAAAEEPAQQSQAPPAEPPAPEFAPPPTIQQPKAPPAVVADQQSQPPQPITYPTTIAPPPPPPKYKDTVAVSPPTPPPITKAVERTQAPQQITTGSAIDAAGVTMELRPIIPVGGKDVEVSDRLHTAYTTAEQSLGADATLEATIAEVVRTTGITGRAPTTVPELDLAYTTRTAIAASSVAEVCDEYLTNAGDVKTDPGSSAKNYLELIHTEVGDAYLKPTLELITPVLFKQLGSVATNVASQYGKATYGLLSLFGDVVVAKVKKDGRFLQAINNVGDTESYKLFEALAEVAEEDASVVDNIGLYSFIATAMTAGNMLSGIADDIANVYAALDPQKVAGKQIEIVGAIASVSLKYVMDTSEQSSLSENVIGKLVEDHPDVLRDAASFEDLAATQDAAPQPAEESQTPDAPLEKIVKEPIAPAAPQADAPSAPPTADARPLPPEPTPAPQPVRDANYYATLLINAGASRGTAGTAIGQLRGQYGKQAQTLYETLETLVTADPTVATQLVAYTRVAAAMKAKNATAADVAAVYEKLDPSKLSGNIGDLIKHIGYGMAGINDKIPKADAACSLIGNYLRGAEPSPTTGAPTDTPSEPSPIAAAALAGRTVVGRKPKPKRNWGRALKYTGGAIAAGIVALVCTGLGTAGLIYRGEIADAAKGLFPQGIEAPEDYTPEPITPTEPTTQRYEIPKEWKDGSVNFVVYGQGYNVPINKYAANFKDGKWNIEFTEGNSSEFNTIGDLIHTTTTVIGAQYVEGCANISYVLQDKEGKPVAGYTAENCAADKDTIIPSLMVSYLRGKKPTTTTVEPEEDAIVTGEYEEPTPAEVEPTTPEVVEPITPPEVEPTMPDLTDILPDPDELAGDIPDDDGVVYVTPVSAEETLEAISQHEGRIRSFMSSKYNTDGDVSCCYDHHNIPIDDEGNYRGNNLVYETSAGGVTLQARLDVTNPNPRKGRLKISIRDGSTTYNISISRDGRFTPSDYQSLAPETKLNYLEVIEPALSKVLTSIQSTVPDVCPVVE